MRYVRFLNEGTPCWGVIEGELVRELDGSVFDAPTYTGHSFDLNGLHLLAPVMPGKLIAVGMNYREHIAEFGRKVPTEPVLFMKPSSAVIGTNANIVYPAISAQVDFEAELAVVIGKTARNVEPHGAMKMVLGYTCGNDVTARDLQTRDGQWTRAKSFDSFCPLGPWLETGVDPHDLQIECRVNGKVRQLSRTSSMIFDPAFLISFVSRVMTLNPGDVILTGTPSGVGPLEIGDMVEVQIEGIGILRNSVVLP